MQEQNSKENRKTITYVLVAAMALLVAWEPWTPAALDDSVPAEVGTKLFPNFKDPLAAKNLEVVKFDEDTATLRPFQVAQVNGVWSIPSHSNYPADAREHMAQAATALLDLEILGVESNNPGDQELYGVITPDPGKLRAGMTGVGTRVTIKDGKDTVLADLVIGKEVKDQPALRYVRRADRDQICRVAIKTDKLSTKFEDWIEKDLLKLNAFDVREVDLNDYSTLVDQRGLGLDLRDHIKLSFDDGQSKWSLVEMNKFDDKGNPVPVKMGEDEELNTEKLNALKTALDDLQIVDVERKPEGLSQDLRASDDFVKNVDTVKSLASRGFYPTKARKGQGIEILSSEGEATCTTKDGVRYILRFGQLAGGEASKDDKGQEDKSKNPALNRFLFVMAQFDENQIAKPKLEPVPGEEEAAEGAKTDEAPKDDADKTKPADEAKPAKPDKQEAAETKTADEEPAADAKDAAKAGEESKSDDKAQAEKSAEGSQDADKAKSDKPAESGEAKKDDKPAAPPTPEEEKRIAIKKENKRKQEEYDSAIKKGKDKVKELNDRFADWYFVIADDVYKKIHLSHDDIVKKKEKADAKAGDEPKGEVLEGIKELDKGLKP